MLIKPQVSNSLIFNNNCFTSLAFFKFLADIDFNSTAIVEEISASVEARQVRCFPVPVIDDDVSNEAEEQFSLVITEVSPVGRISNGEIRVTIIDNDSKSYLIFARFLDD